jgi:uncharacterized protein with NRDE domain
VCTLALYFNVFAHYPLLLAANRDEHYERLSAPPTLISRKPAILAGKDLLAGGTWLGVNEHGLVVGILNRRVNQEQTPGNFRSRGLLCLDLLGLRSAARAKEYLQQRPTGIYQPFTLAFADEAQAWTAANFGERIETARLNPGLHVFSNTGTHDGRSEKRTRAYGLFNAAFSNKEATVVDPGDLPLRLRKILGDHTLGNNSADPREAICVHGESSGTVSSTVVIYSQLEQQFHTFYCPGSPCRNSFSESLRLAVQ